MLEMSTSTDKATNKTIFLSFPIGVNSISQYINIPHPVTRIVFRSLAFKGVVTDYAVLSSSLIQDESIGVVFRDSSFSNSTAQTIEYNFRNPVTIAGQYTFNLTKLDNTPVVSVAIENCVFIGEFIYEEKVQHQ